MRHIIIFLSVLFLLVTPCHSLILFQTDYDGDYCSQLTTETSTPFSINFLPIATTTTSSIVKQMKNVNNAEGDAPTAENFNQLLRQLKNVGLMK